MLRIGKPASVCLMLALAGAGLPQAVPELRRGTELALLRGLE